MTCPNSGICATLVVVQNKVYFILCDPCRLYIWPAFQKMHTGIFAGSIDTVMVWKLDRLARNLKDGINTVPAAFASMYSWRLPGPNRRDA